MEFRTEHDTMGEVRVPADRYWAAQTQRSLENFRIEPSQGSHFFQNMTSFNVGYMNVDPWARPLTDAYDQSVLDALPALAETDFLRHVRLDKPLEMYIDGFENKAIVKK
jgi:fumarate hydratase class II